MNWTATTGSLTTYTETRWSPMGELPASAALLLLAGIVGGYFLGKRLGIRSWAWCLVWAFPLVMGRVAYGQKSSLSGWLMLLGLAGMVASGAWAFRATLPVQPLADERQVAEPVEPAPEPGGGLERA